MTRHRSVGFMLLAVLLSACGPKVQVQTSVTSQLTNIFLGAPKGAAAEQLPPQPTSPSFPGIVAPVPPAVAPAPATAPPPPVATPVPQVVCPPLSGFPRIPAAALSPKGPVAGKLAYRQSGSSVSDSDPAVLLHGNDVRTIAVDPTATGALYTFTVTQKSFGRATIASTYSLVPPSSDQSVTIPGTAAGNPPETLNATGGLYLQRIETKSPAGTRVFAPVGLGVEVYQEPAAPGASWSSSATDPNTQTSVLVQGAISGHAVANACGQAIDTWKVTLTQTVLGAAENLTQKQTLLVAPQYGCLIVDEQDEVTGSFDGHTITQKLRSTVNSLPRQP
jgi:hypothetical protein